MYHPYNLLHTLQENSYERICCINYSVNYLYLNFGPKAPSSVSYCQDVRIVRDFVNSFVNVKKLRIEFNMKQLYNSSNLRCSTIFVFGGDLVQETEAKITFNNEPAEQIYSVEDIDDDGDLDEDLVWHDLHNVISFEYTKFSLLNFYIEIS